MVTAGEAIRDPYMIEVDLCGMIPKAISTTPVPPLFSTIKPQPNITKTLNLHIQGDLDRLQWTFPATSVPYLPAQHPWQEALIGALGWITPMGVEDLLNLEGPDLAAPEPLATS